MATSSRGCSSEDSAHAAPRSWLARAWCAARYEVLLPGGALPLRIGEPAAALEARLPADAYLWITAWNPPLAARTAALNRRADQRLLAHLRERGRVPVPARASDGAGGAGDGKGATPLTGGSGADVTVGGREDVAGAMVEGSVEVDGDAPGAEGAAALGVCFALSAGGGV